MSGWICSRTRRTLDIAVAVAVLLLFAVPMLLLAVCIRLTSRGRVLFSQQRVGMRGTLFRIYKFRSMTESKENCGPGLTRAGDSRITLLGRAMRKFKIDELPQFYNVLRGEMSLVGPRPKLPQYAAVLHMAYRPGITGAASVAFRHEEELMRSIEQAELDRFYAQNIQPVKARLDACYMCQATPVSDLQIVTETLLSWMGPAATARLPAAGPLAASAQAPAVPGAGSRSRISRGTENAAG